MEFITAGYVCVCWLICQALLGSTDNSTTVGTDITLPSSVDTIKVTISLSSCKHHCWISVVLLDCVYLGLLLRLGRTVFRDLLEPKVPACHASLFLQLCGDSFDALYVSPLTRATQTADIITQGRELRTTTLPSLREIDLYSFQVSKLDITTFFHWLCMN